MRTRHIAAAVVLLAACLAAAGWQRASTVISPKDQIILEEFQRKVTAYADLHRDIEGPIPTVRVSEHPAEIQAAMRDLAERIRRARPHAQQGDFFTPETATLFRRLIRQGCAGDLMELLAAVSDEAPRWMRTPHVNERWPEGAPFSMVPPNVLCQLPLLPEELEYRFVNRDLVLWDMHADLVVDVLIRAIPPGTNEES